jgi:hypothetical protein
VLMSIDEVMSCPNLDRLCVATAARPLCVHCIHAGRERVSVLTLLCLVQTHEYDCLMTTSCILRCKRQRACQCRQGCKQPSNTWQMMLWRSQRAWRAISDIVQQAACAQMAVTLGAPRSCRQCCLCSSRDGLLSSRASGTQIVHQVAIWTKWGLHSKTSCSWTPMESYRRRYVNKTPQLLLHCFSDAKTCGKAGFIQHASSVGRRVQPLKPPLCSKLATCSGDIILDVQPRVYTA